VALESVIVRPVDSLHDWRVLLNDPRQPAVLIGPGLGLGAAAADEVLATLETKRPCVVDADALTNFAGCPDNLFQKLHADCVLTPHEGEFARLFGGIDPAADKIDRARVVAKQTGCIVVLKGHETVIAAPDGQGLVNRNAPAWLATAGSGDVLAGMILGLIAQKMPVLWAAAAAVWLHGRIAATHGSGLIAEDIVEGIPQALAALHF
jgi:NAD(P)H-hydrate epimerase